MQNTQLITSETATILLERINQTPQASKSDEYEKLHSSIAYEIRQVIYNGAHCRPWHRTPETEGVKAMFQVHETHEKRFRHAVHYRRASKEFKPLYAENPPLCTPQILRAAVSALADFEKAMQAAEAARGNKGA